MKQIANKDSDTSDDPRYESADDHLGCETQFHGVLVGYSIHIDGVMRRLLQTCILID